MGCSGVSPESTLGTFLTIQLVLQTVPEAGLSHSLTRDYRGDIDGQTVGHRGYIRLQKQREVGCGSSPRPLYSTETTESPKYAGSGCGLTSTDMKHMGRNHNFSFLQAQKTDAFLALNIWKTKSMRSYGLPFIHWVLLGPSGHIISLRTDK